MWTARAASVLHGKLVCFCRIYNLPVAGSACACGWREPAGSIHRRWRATDVRQFPSAGVWVIAGGLEAQRVAWGKCCSSLPGGKTEFTMAGALPGVPDGRIGGQGSEGGGQESEVRSRRAGGWRKKERIKLVNHAASIMPTLAEPGLCHRP
jgi:hypothetical protein